jgi:hypothetical protein
MVVVSCEATSGGEADYAGERVDRAGSMSCSSVRSLLRIGERAEELADARARARLIADIGRLIRDPSVPEVTRLAGLTLIGWLARRRPGEPAHEVGVEEARQSERVWQAAGTKVR